jgi:hypothetical protein
MGYVCGHRQQPSDQPHMGTAFTPAKTSLASWDAFRDVEVNRAGIVGGSNS